MRWPGWCCTSGEHGRDGTSETVEKIGSNANEFFKAQKSNCKSPAAPQCCERLLNFQTIVYQKKHSKTYLHHVLKEHQDHCTNFLLLLIMVYNTLLSKDHQ